LRLAYVVQRYGPEIRGGAEAHCREYAKRLASHGHTVEVFTTRAVDYRTWRNDLAEGTSMDEGVAVRRFTVVQERPDEFDELTAQVLAEPKHVPRDVQERWMHMQGPLAPSLVDALRSEREVFDLVIFVTYLYYTTYHGLSAAPTRAVLHPTAHDEPPLRLPIFADMFRIPKAFVFLTEDERSIVHERFEIAPVAQAVIGIGVDTPVDIDPGRGRRALRTSDRYVLCLGRMDAAKGIDHLIAFFRKYRARSDQRVDLILAGDNVAQLHDEPGIVVAGLLDEQEKWDLLAGAAVLVHPSYFESFAMNLLEAWSVGTPAVVNGYCGITSGHCRRSGGGLWYRSYAEFEACLDRLLRDEELRVALGCSGRHYVESLYNWTTILNRYVGFLESVGESLAR
jgi:glycosyltransferase involved in cell wall biosynthesis